MQPLHYLPAWSSGTLYGEVLRARMTGYTFATLGAAGRTEKAGGGVGSMYMHACWPPASFLHTPAWFAGGWQGELYQTRNCGLRLGRKKKHVSSMDMAMSSDRPLCVPLCYIAQHTSCFKTHIPSSCPKHIMQREARHWHFPFLSHGPITRLYGTAPLHAVPSI